MLACLLPPRRETNDNEEGDSKESSVDRPAWHQASFSKPPQASLEAGAALFPAVSCWKDKVKVRLNFGRGDMRVSPPSEGYVTLATCLASSAVRE